MRGNKTDNKPKDSKFIFEYQDLNFKTKTPPA